MKSIQSLSRLIVFACLLAIAAPLAAQDRVPWITDLRQARDLAERQNRLVLLHFWSEDCAPCKRLERYVFNQPEFIRALTTGYIPVKINVQAQPRLKDFYNVTSWPTDVIVTPEGREVQRFTSKQDANNYIAMLDGIRARASVNGYIPVASRNSGSGGNATSTQPYGDNDSPSTGSKYGQNAPAINQGAASQVQRDQPQNQSGNRYVNPLDRNLAPQQQNIAPRYANPYGASPKTSSNNQESGSTRHRAPQNSSHARTAHPTANPYVTENAQENAQRDQNAQATNAPANRAPSQPYGNVQQNQWSQSDQWSQSAPPHPQPNQNQNASRSAPQRSPKPSTSNNPPIALDGYCPVTLVHKRGWAEGDKRWGAKHEGRIYLFVGPEEQRAFLANPNLYAPLLSGFDPVKYAETGQLVPGRREFGLYIDEPGPIALFADEAALQRFHGNSAHYFNAIRQAKRQQQGQNAQR